MSVLYGNDVMAQYARSNARPDYPPGSVLSLVTWTETEDNAGSAQPEFPGK